MSICLWRLQLIAYLQKYYHVRPVRATGQQLQSGDLDLLRTCTAQHMVLVHICERLRHVLSFFTCRYRV